MYTMCEWNCERGLAIADAAMRCEQRARPPRVRQNARSTTAPKSLHVTSLHVTSYRLNLAYGIRVRNVQPHASHLTKWVLPSDFIVRVSFMSHLQINRFNRENLHGMEREVSGCEWRPSHPNQETEDCQTACAAHPFWLNKTVETKQT